MSPIEVPAKIQLVEKRETRTMNNCTILQTWPMPTNAF